MSEYEERDAMPKKTAPAETKEDLYGGCSAGARDVQRGHWKAFTMYCTAVGLNHGPGLTKMIEDCVPKQYLDLVYGPGKWHKAG